MQSLGRASGAANAKQTNTNTGEGAPVSNFYRSPAHRVTDGLFGVGRPGSGVAMAKGQNAPTASGIRMARHVFRLRAWVGNFRGGRELLGRNH